MRTNTFVSIAGGLILGLPVLGYACDLKVSNSTELHSAIGNPTNSGKVICLEKGIYLPDPSNRNISFNITVDNVTLRGLGSKNQVVLSGNIGDSSSATDNSQHVVTMSNRTRVVLENLSVLDGYNDQARTLVAPFNGWGAGILAVQTDLLLDRVVLRNNTLTGANGSGAALALLNSRGSIQNSNISNNTASGFAAVYTRDLGLGGDTTLDIKNSDFLNNIANNNGGAVFGAFNSSINIENSRFIANVGALCCGALRMDVSGSTGTLNIKNSVFESNSTPTGRAGAIAAGGNLTATIDTTKFINNSAGLDGGAIDNITGAVDAGSYTISNSLFSGGVVGRDGGGVNLAFSPGQTCSFTLENTHFIENTATRSGGAIWSACSGSVSNSKFESNIAVSGGAILQGFVPFSLSNSIFLKNDATDFGKHVACEAPGSISTLFNTQFLLPEEQPVGCGP